MLLGCVLGTALATLAATPAQAQNGTSQSHGVTVHRGFDNWGDGDRNRHRRHRGDDINFATPRGPRPDATVVDYGIGYGSGEWALYNNRTFEPDSYNDWWHERLNRSYPRWMQNGSCDRQWWGGGGWRCSWK
jgi:hypothetical protein